MNKTFRYSFAAIAAVAVISLFVGSKPVYAQVVEAIVRLQQTTPGIKQTGHTNISGTSIAAEFKGGSVSVNNSTSNVAAINSVIASPFDYVSAVFGQATNTTVQNYGGYFYSAGPNGTGCVGWASSAVGNPNGGWFRSDAPGGNGVTGIATATTGDAYGGNFYTNSNAGVGVYGEATALTGDAYGGKFVNNSDTGSGVYGLSNSERGFGGYFVGGLAGVGGSGQLGVSGNSFVANGNGGLFVAFGAEGIGVFGRARGSTGLNYGVYGDTLSSAGWAGYFTGGNGVYASKLEVNSRTTTNDFTMKAGSAANTVLLGAAGGVASWGKVDSARLTSDPASLSKVTGGTFAMSGSDMQGADQSMIQLFTGSTEKIRLNPNTPTSGAFINVSGPNGNHNVRATFLASNPDHGFLAVHDSLGSQQAYMNVNANGDGVITADTKNFKVPDPTDPRFDILYACVEGPEAAMYTRGTGRLVNGQAVIDLPDHFLKLANMGTLTIQVTPLDECEGLFCRKGDSQFMVKELRKGTSNIEFDWEVKAVRKGHEDYKVVRPWDDALPDGDVKQQWNARLKSIANRAAKGQNSSGRP
ncbi:MAG: hypothetical protein HONBIEJF_00204 [Fimbriimonadaceae bacterium]|nr:hypothetical protein [Fimbriimonadaceae bacterium]